MPIAIWPVCAEHEHEGCHQPPELCPTGCSGPGQHREAWDLRPSPRWQDIPEAAHGVTLAPQVSRMYLADAV